MCLEGGLDNVGVRCQKENDVAGGLLRQKVSVDSGRLGEGKEFRVLAFNGGKANVSVLEVWACISLKREHTLPVKRVVVDT